MQTYAYVYRAQLWQSVCSHKPLQQLSMSVIIKKMFNTIPRLGNSNHAFIHMRNGP